MPSALSGHPAYVKVADYYLLDPREIHVVPGHNPRTVFDREALDTLKASIKANGVRMPIKVRKNGDQLELISGERRLRATLELIDEGVPIVGIPAILAEKHLKNADTLLLEALIENQGAPLQPLEEAQAFQRLLNYGWDIARVATSIGRSAGYVSGRLTLLEAEPVVQQALLAGDIGVTQAVQVVRNASRNGQEQSEALEAQKDARKTKASQKSQEQAKKALSWDNPRVAQNAVASLCEERGVRWLLENILGCVNEAVFLEAIEALYPGKSIR